MLASLPFRHRQRSTICPCPAATRPPPRRDARPDVPECTAASGLLWAAGAVVTAPIHNKGVWTPSRSALVGRCATLRDDADLDAAPATARERAGFSFFATPP